MMGNKIRQCNCFYFANKPNCSWCPYQEDLCPTEPESVGKNGHRCRKEQKGSITSLISSLADAVFP